MAAHKLPGEFWYDGVAYSGMLTSRKMLDGVRALDLSSEDVAIMSYPKSGSVWTRCLVCLILNGGNQHRLAEDLSNILAMEFSMGAPEEKLLQSYRDAPSPRLMTGHLPLRFLHEQVLQQKVKVIVMMRNPKDALVSYYHFYVMLEGLGCFKGTWNDFFEMFKQKRLFAGDIFQTYLEWWQARHLPNVCILMFEEAKQDLEGAVRKVAKFLEKDLSIDVIGKIAEEASFGRMKENQGLKAFFRHPAFGMTEPDNFLRKGEIGDWKNYFSEEQAEYVAKLCAEMFHPVGLDFMDS